MSLNKKPTIDPYLIMDDIMEKLKLLDYENQFWARFGRKQIVRIYFALKDYKDNTDEKFKYFYDLCYWLMTFQNSNKRIVKKEFKLHKSK